MASIAFIDEVQHQLLQLNAIANTAGRSSRSSVRTPTPVLEDLAPDEGDDLLNHIP